MGKLHFTPLHFIQNLTLILTYQIVTLNPLHFGQVSHCPSVNSEANKSYPLGSSVLQF